MKTNKKFRERAEEARKEGVGFAFCPKHLEIEGRDDLWVFPYNILFMKFRGEEDGSQTAGSAVYVPDLSTLSQELDVWSMTYRNQYGGNSYVIISVTLSDLVYQGYKYINDVLVGSATGKVCADIEGEDNGWHLFFFHLTMLGLSAGERCMFISVTQGN